jgi:hypothetical protein
MLDNAYGPQRPHESPRQIATRLSASFSGEIVAILRYFSHLSRARSREKVKGIGQIQSAAFLRFLDVMTVRTSTFRI